MPPETLSWILLIVALLELPVYVAVKGWMSSRRRQAEEERELEDRIRLLENWRNEHAGEHRGFDRGWSSLMMGLTRNNADD